MHSILFAIYAYSSHCISINVAQVACAWCMTDASLWSRLSLPYFFLSPSPLLLAVTSTCGWEQELPFSGMAGQLDLFLSCLVEINASDVLGTGGCHWLLQRRLYDLCPHEGHRGDIIPSLLPLLQPLPLPAISVCHALLASLSDTLKRLLTSSWVFFESLSCKLFWH